MDTKGLDEGEFQGHLPCKSCGSSDGLADYGDHTYCFVCDEYTKNQEHEDKLSERQRNFANHMLQVMVEVTNHEHIDKTLLKK